MIYSALVELCLKYGKDFQGLFYTTEAYYKSCFIYPQDCHLNEVIDILKDEYNDIVEVWEGKKREMKSLISLLAFLKTKNIDFNLKIS